MHNYKIIYKNGQPEEIRFSPDISQWNDMGQKILKNINFSTLVEKFPCGDLITYWRYDSGDLVTNINYDNRDRLFPRETQEIDGVEYVLAENQQNKIILEEFDKIQKVIDSAIVFASNVNTFLNLLLDSSHCSLSGIISNLKAQDKSMSDSIDSILMKINR